MTELVAPDRRSVIAGAVSQVVAVAEPRGSLTGAGLVAAAVYEDGRKVAQLSSIEEVTGWLGRPGHVVWIGLFEPTDELLAQAQQQFGLHDLAIEDARNAHQRPKIEQYGDSLFVVARTAQSVGGTIAFGETHIFVGQGYVVTIRHGASRSYGAVRRRCESCQSQMRHGEDYILYAVLDFIVDDYGPVIDTVHQEVDALEERVLSGTLPRAQVERLYRLRRDLLRLRNAVLPLIDVCKRLEHANAVAVHPEMQPLFRDVNDHVHRVAEGIDSLREVLAFAFEASLMLGQSQQNDTTRRLAAWAAILAVPTAVAGIYGMNFTNMPELSWRFGYPAVLLAILSVSTGLYIRFKRQGWL